MNLFILSYNLKKCASYHFDKHVIKMILEATQLLCTAHRVCDPTTTLPLYKATHVNHPMAVWVRSHINNYKFTILYARALCDEYRHRYGENKRHKCEDMLLLLERNLPAITTDKSFKLITKHRITKPPQCMPDEYKAPTTVEAYRQYYSSPMKSHLRSWRRRGAPWWLASSTVSPRGV